MTKTDSEFTGADAVVEADPQSSAPGQQPTTALTAEGRRNQLRLTKASKLRVQELRAQMRKRQQIKKPS